MHANRISVFLFTALIAVATIAHVQNGVIQGTLVDAQGGNIADAKVVATDEVKSLVARETVSSSTGEFSLFPLSPGTYTVKVSSTGMKPLERRGVVLGVNQTLKRKFRFSRYGVRILTQ